jgi:two-component system, OmpR family, sensor kinase
MTPPRSGLRRHLQLSVIGAVGLALVVLIAAFNVLLRERLSADADNVLAARAAAEVATLQIRDSRVLVPEAPDAGELDARTWVFSGHRLIEGPRSDLVTERAAREMSSRSRGTQNVAATQRRLHVVPVLDHRRRVGSVVAEVSLVPYNKTAHTALVASLVLGGVILALVALAARYLISAALRPVAHMTAQAAAWSEADTGRRFALGPPHDELTQLAATLDSLLDRVATSLRHEQRFSSELSHELRSPLASVIAEAQLALRHPRTAAEHRAGYERVLASAQQMRRTLETLLSAARVQLQGVHGSGDASAAVRAAVNGCKPLAAEHGITVASVLAEHAFRIGVETEVAERVLAPLLENACRFGRSAVTVSALRRDGAVELHVADDGAGVPAADRQRVFEPGFSSGLNGAGLGLPLARRLARAAGGDVELADRDPGACFVVRLPAA